MEQAGWTFRKVSMLEGEGYVISPWLNETLENNGRKTRALKQQTEGKANGFWM